VLVSTNAGDDLCIGHNAEANGQYHLARLCAATQRERSNEPLHDHRNTRRAFQYAVHHPGREVVLLFRKAYYTVANDHDSLIAMGSFLRDKQSHHPYRMVFARVADVWFWVMCALGLFAVTQRRPFEPRRRMFLFAAVALAIAPLVFFGNPRFKVPVEPFLAVAAAVSVDALLVRRSQSPT
jgi:hypothetical protein